MKPILYNNNETSFTSFGLGVLSDCLSCIVTEKLNGKYECEFSYPITGKMYNEIVPDRIIKVKPNETSNLQLFRIYRNAKPINGIVKFYAQHISYDLATIIVKPLGDWLNMTPTAMLGTIFNTNNSVFSHSFTAYSDVSGKKNFVSNSPKSIRKWLGNSEGSILNLFQGEYEFDNFTVKFLQNRGQDNGVKIRYGRNLVDISADINIDSLYDYVYPYVIDSEGNYKELTEKIIKIIPNSSRKRILTLDVSNQFEHGETITESMIREAANKIVSESKINEINQNLTVKFVNLRDDPDYAGFENLETVKMGDFVTVEYSDLGINSKLQVIGTKYDVLKERYESIELGNEKQSLPEKLLGITQRAAESEQRSKSALRQAIEEATEMITGGMGGYVVLEIDESTGYPREFLVMDTPDKSTAVNVWRWTSGGLGHSHSGYNGPYDDIALTANGKINASMITVGTLTADLIKAGTLSDSSGTLTINMTTGKMTIKGQYDSQTEIWSNGVTLKDSRTGTVKASMYVSVNNVGVLTTNQLLVGDRDNEKVCAFVHATDGGVVSCDKIQASHYVWGNNDLAYYSPINITDGLGNFVTVLAFNYP